MAGGADDWLAADAGIGLLRGADGCGTGVGVEMDAVGSGIEGELGRTINEDAGTTFGGAHGFDHAGGEGLQLGEGQIFFADLDGVDAASGPLRGERNEAVTLRVLVTVKEAAIRDGVEEHQKLV
jgi:hypothetical protein